MVKEKERIKKILINFPTNIGDVILTFPALDLIRASYPYASITAIVSPHTKEFLFANKNVDEMVVYNKHWKVREKIRFVNSLKRKYDLIVDFKNSLLPLLLRIPYRTPFLRFPHKQLHAYKEYLKIVENLISKKEAPKSDFSFDLERESLWKNKDLDKAVFIATHSRSSLKVYPKDMLKKLLKMLPYDRVVLIGDIQSKTYYKDVTALDNVFDLSGKTTFLDVYYLLKNCALVCICVDSAILHLASYLNIPVVALFGPTDEKRYGPWSDKFVVVKRKELSCIPCQKAQCRYKKPYCMQISPEEIVEAVKHVVG